MEEYIIERQPMICGSYEAEIRKYHKYQGKKEGSIWLVADQPNAGDNIYYCDFDPKSQGFAGRTLHFTLVDSTEIDLPAPWHSNSEHLFRDTGVDTRDKHLTFVVIAKRRELTTDYQTIYKDIVYIDKEPQIGYFDRGRQMARQLAKQLDIQLFCYSRSQGGSSDSPIDPDEKD